MNKPRRLGIEEIAEGMVYEETISLTQDRLDRFIALSDDRALAHVDDAHAQGMGFSGTIVHGFLVGLPYSRILGMFLPGSKTVIHSLSLNMVAPVYVGDDLVYRVTVERVIPSVKSVRLKLEAFKGEAVVSRGSTTCVFRAG